MGYYTTFEIDVTLDKETPAEIINFLVDKIYRYSPSKPHFFKNQINQILSKNNAIPSQHRFFTLERWENIFSFHEAHRPPAVYPTGHHGYYRLSLAGDSNYSWKEITEFIDFISPYIAGRKKKLFVGWMKGDGDRQRTDLYRVTK